MATLPRLKIQCDDKQMEEQIQNIVLRYVRARMFVAVRVILLMIKIWGHHFLIHESLRLRRPNILKLLKSYLEALNMHAYVLKAAFAACF